MRALVIACIAAVTGVMAYLWLQPVCKDGHVVRDEAACVKAAGFDAVFCRKAFARTKDIASWSGTSYPTLFECNQRWPKCMERGKVGEAVPVPTSWCLVRSPSGDVARLAPQYDNYKQ